VADPVRLEPRAQLAALCSLANHSQPSVATYAVVSSGMLHIRRYQQYAVHTRRRVVIDCRLLAKRLAYLEFSFDQVLFHALNVDFIKN
jgi:hypothetical protein